MNANNAEQCVISMIANLFEEPAGGNDIKIDDDSSDNSDNNTPYFQKNYVRQNSNKIKTENFADQRYIEKVWQPINKSSSNIPQCVNLFQDFEFLDNEHKDFHMLHKEEKPGRIKSADHNSHSREVIPLLTLNDCTVANTKKQKRSTKNMVNIMPKDESSEQAAFDCLKDVVASEKRINEKSFAYLKDHFYALVTFHNGSRIFQEALFQTDYQYIIAIFNELSDNFKDLVIHPYANYFVQKLFERLDYSDRINFLNKIHDSIGSIANNSKGTFFLQKIFDILYHDTLTEGQQIVIHSISPILHELAMNEFGCHVIEKMVEVFNENLILGIVKELVEKFLLLAYHCHGVCAVKKTVGYVKDPEISETVFQIVIENFMQLIHHSSGNYIIQEAIDKWEPGQRRATLFNLFKNNYYSFAMNKTASSVVEKCFQKEEITIKHFVDEICAKTKLLELMKSQYGNYVVKKSLECAKGHIKPKLIHNLNKNLKKLTDKKLIEKWNKILEEYPSSNCILDPNGRSNNNESVDSHSSQNSDNSNEKLSSTSAKSSKSEEQEEKYSNMNNIPAFSSVNETKGGLLRNMISLSSNIQVSNMPCLSPKMRASLMQNKQSERLNNVLPLGLQVNQPMISLNPPMSYPSFQMNPSGQCNIMNHGSTILSLIYPNGQQLNNSSNVINKQCRKKTK